MGRSARRLSRTEHLGLTPGEWRRVKWSGYTWSVRPTMDNAAPDSNAWSDSTSNVWVDSATGDRYLGITAQNGIYRCVQLDGTAHGYGTYRWVVAGLSEPFDEYSVLGLFTYDFALGDTTNAFREIDIEFSHWGSTTETSLIWYTVQPPEPLSLVTMRSATITPIPVNSRGSQGTYISARLMRAGECSVKISPASMCRHL